MDYTSFIPIASAGSTVVLVVLVAFKEWKSGTDKIGHEVILNYKNLDEQQKRTIEEYKLAWTEATTTIKAMEAKFGAQVAKYEGIILAKDKQIDDLTKIVSNRNPELETVLTNIRDFMKSLVEANASQVRILESQQQRNKKIDEASDKHVGELLRKPAAVPPVQA